MRRRVFQHVLKLCASLAAVAVVAGLMAPASAAGGAGDGTWLTQATHPARVLQSVRAHGDKLPPEFNHRLRYVQPDGTLRVIVALGGRSPAVDGFVGAHTTALKWFEASPGFFATVTPDQLGALLDAAFVTFVEPDYPIGFSLALSVPDVHARTAGTSSGIWSFDATAGRLGALKSEIAGLSADQVTGKGVTVAVIDSGIDKTHRDFGGWDCTPGPYAPCQSRVKRTVTAEHLIGTNGFTNGPNSNAGDDLPTTDLVSGHGTHVTGIIAGNSYYVRDFNETGKQYAKDTFGGDGHPFGMAPQASLINIKNGDSQSAGFGTIALDWLAANAGKYGVRVANNSWGCVGGCTFDGNSATNQTFKALYQAGVVVTFAGGNDAGGTNGAAFNGSAQSPYVLGVASYDAKNHQLASNSSRGSSAAALPSAATWTPESEPVNGHRRPDVAAPGVAIWSTRSLTGGTSSLLPRQSTADVSGGFGCCATDEYVTMSGTSMATPHVTGAAALLFGACPSATSLDAMRAIMVGADSTRVLKTGSTTTKAQPFETGYGGLDVRASLAWLRSQPVCAPAPTNRAPIATDDTLSLNQGSTATVNVLANDSDPDGDALSVVSTTTPSGGTITVKSDGISYAARSDFFGTDSFDYVVSDGKGGTDTGRVTVTVNGAPIANGDSAATNQGRAVTISATANDSDPEGDAFSVTSTSTPAHGTASVGSDGVITYTPAADFYGTDSFEYEIADAKGAGDVGRVTVSVNGAPVAKDDSGATKKKDAIRINVIGNDTDPEGDALSLKSATQPSQGSVDCSTAGTCTYNPNGRYKGVDSFTYIVCDARGACDEGLVKVTTVS